MTPASLEGPATADLGSTVDPPRLAIDSVSMTFGSACVLTDVSLEVRPGEIHALIGQNGSGKSTLARVLTGLLVPDPGGRVAVDGVDLRLPVRPDEARARGVAVVHQSLGLLTEATVLENMRIGRLRGSRVLRRIDWAAERKAAAAVFERLGRTVPLDASIAELREEERATVAIARALQGLHPGTGLIIFDESTRALGRRALEHFFAILDEIVATGTSVLMITHRLEEVVDVADRVTVLRDGRVVDGSHDVAGLSEADLTALMLGRALTTLDRTGTGTTDPKGRGVTVESVRGLGVLDVSLRVSPGEVLGLTGISGSGYDDVPYLLSGVRPATHGAVRLRTTTVALAGLTPARAIEAGIALVPEGREVAGLAMTATVAENTAFPQTCRSRRALRPLRTARERALVDTWMERLDVRPRAPHALVRTLSGGNQQKVLLAKWLATNPTLLVLHEPTQAVDVGARHVIVQAIRDAARNGCAVIVAGSDENELSLLCDRIAVFEDGVVREELTGDLSPDRIVAAIYASSARSRLRQRSPSHA